MITKNYNNPFEVKIVETHEEREKVFKLRYEIFVGEIGYAPNYANHTQKIIQEPLDNSAKIFAGFYNGQVIATSRINLSRNSDLGYYPQIYKMQEFAGDAYPQYTSISNYFLIKKEFRGSRIILELIQLIYKKLLSENVKFDFLDCEQYMVPLYTKLGYQNMGEMYHPEFGKGYLMMLDIFKNAISNPTWQLFS
ncbi:hypothetical protein NIES2101_13185 [Calothrix sp. HK-06]|nr:hypothetical protein NIES2101_13185 [Calothrix sp. HK-06]